MRKTLLRLGVILLLPLLPPLASAGSLDELSKTIRPSVVEVLGTIEATRDTSYGTGFAIGEEDLVLTNAHVVRGVAELMVRTWEGALLASVKVLHVDERVDLAVLRVTGLHLRPLSPAASDLPPVGQHVVAVGHPRGYEFTVSDGIVSAVRRIESEGPELIQTTTPISPGSSGGPLLDDEGRVVGVCSLTLTEGQNINFAVPVREVAPVLERARVIERALAEEDPRVLPAPALTELVRRHRLSGDVVRARELAEDGLSIHPRDTGLLAEAAEVAWSRGDYEEVGRLVRRMEGIDPEFAPARQLEAARLAQLGRCEEAIGQARLALRMGLDEQRAAEAHAVLAECLGRAGDLEAAIEHVEQALGSGEISALPDYHALHAFLLHAAGRADEADAAAISALEASSWDPLVVAALRERGLPRLVEVVSFQPDRTGSTVTVRGVVRNRGPVPVQEVVVTAEGFADGGELMATGSSTVLPTRLVPGQSGAFTIEVQGNPGRAESFEVRIVDFRD